MILIIYSIMDCNPTKYEKEDFDINDTMLDVTITPSGFL